MQDYQVQTVLQDLVEQTEQLVHQVVLDPAEQMELQVHQDLLELLVHQAFQV